jgi:hypothetical protein
MKYLLVAVFSFYVLIISLFSLQEFPAPDTPKYFVPHLAERPLSEDGFYSLKVAWNIGRGEGIVYNYSQPTTGIQPLYVFVASVLSYVNKIFGGDKFTFLRMIILLSGILSLIFAFVIKRVAQKILPSIDQRYLFNISILLVLFNFKIFLNLFNGLETGLYLVLLGLCINYSYHFFSLNLSNKSKILFGLLIGITSLARIDFIIIAFAFIISLAILKKISVIDSLIIFLVALTVVSPWFIYVYSVQGSFIQSSALVQSAVQTAEIGYRIDQFFFSITSNIVPFYHTGLTQTILFYPVALLILIFLSKFQMDNIKLIWYTEITRSWLIGLITISVIYLLFAAQPFFYFRYLSIWSTVTLPFVAIIITQWLSKKSKKIFYFIVIATSLFFFANVFYYFHCPKVVSGLALRPSFIQKYLNNNNKIGMAQSGISGYFFDNVVNLDGKVNTEALTAIKSDNLFEYISKEKIDVLMEWEEWFDLFLKDSILHKFNYVQKKVGDNKTIVYKSK